MVYKKGDWYIYCDICGQRTYASKSTKLSTYTGRGGCIVCKHDVDAVDPKLIPYRFGREQNIPWARVGDNDTTDGSPTVDPETMTYNYYLAASQDDAILMASQDDAWLLATINV